MFPRQFLYNAWCMVKLKLVLKRQNVVYLVPQSSVWRNQILHFIWNIWSTTVHYLQLFSPLYIWHLITFLVEISSNQSNNIAQTEEYSHSTELYTQLESGSYEVRAVTVPESPGRVWTLEFCLFYLGEINNLSPTWPPSRTPPPIVLHPRITLS